MNEQLVKLLMDRVGLDEAKANQAINTVMGFFKENPEKITELLDNEQVAAALDKLQGGLGAKAKGLFG